MTSTAGSAQANQSFCDLFGITTQTGQLVGTPAAELAEQVKTAFADPAEFLRRTSRLHEGRRPTEGEQFSCADGRTIEGDYWPVFAEGEYRGDLWLFWDISERKALEEQRDRMLRAELAARDAAEQAQQRLAEQNVKLKELDEAKSEFLATMSHELRTPLTSIVSFVELVLERRAAARRRRPRIAAHHPQKCGAAAAPGRRPADAEPGGGRGAVARTLGDVEVPELIDESVRAASASAAERGIRIDVSVPDGPPLHADQLRLQQVLDNLLSNAVKFSRDGSRVTVTADAATGRPGGSRWPIRASASRPPTWISCLTGSSGAPTPPRPACREPVWGCPSSKAITELHGGRVEVLSTLGTRHDLQRLPAGRPMTAQVLCIEDDADIALAIGLVLRGGGLEVSTAADGRDGLQRIS